MTKRRDWLSVILIVVLLIALTFCYVSLYNEINRLNEMYTIDMNKQEEVKAALRADLLDCSDIVDSLLLVTPLVVVETVTVSVPKIVIPSEHGVMWTKHRVYNTDSLVWRPEKAY